ncbi:MAG TPA: cysteine desulfurase family protein [Bacilli bacterium]|nr:cysteine desulfurase family protein [Bacilli bacterium]
MIYFDNSATTPVHPEVVEAMLPYLNEIFGNPASKYYAQAEKAKTAVEEARLHVANLLGGQPDEVVFTSGSTESNNFVLKGIADYYPGAHIITTKAEHPSIIETAEYLAAKGEQVTFLDVDQYARIDLEDLRNTILNSTSDTILVSIIWGNNEVGSLNDIEAISKLCHELRSKERTILLHTDATQVVGKVPVDLSNSGVNLLSCSSHKLHGPKGIGACIIRKHKSGTKIKMTPLIHGGDQETGYRSGTLSVHNIVGFGKAAEIALRDFEEVQAHLTRLENYLVEELTSKLPSSLVHFNNDFQNKIPGIVNVRFQRINNEVLLRKLSPHVALSTGSACSSSKPSHVLQGMGLTLDDVRSSVRISMSKVNTVEDVDAFIRLLTS